MTSHTYRLSLALVISVGVLAACGGGGGGGGSPAPSTLSGAVIDGYLKNAVVCLDINANLKCDGASEYQTRSGDYGAYVLNVAAGVDVSKYHVLAEVGTDATDSDTNAAPAKAYNLLAPAVDAVVVTPLTTFVSKILIANNGLTLEEAKSQVLIDLNLPSTTKLNQDYVAANDTKTHRVAKVAAALLGQVKFGILTVIPTATESQRIEMEKEVIRQAKSTLASYAVAAQATNGDGLPAIQTAALADASKQVAANQENIKKQAALGNGVALSLADLIKSGGLFDIWADYSGIYGVNSTLTEVLEGVQYSRIFSNDGTKVTFETYFSPKSSPAWTMNGGWLQPNSSTTSVDYTSIENKTTWIDNTDIGTATWKHASENGVGTLTFDKTDASLKISIKVIDVSGKKGSEVPYLLGNPEAYCGRESLTANKVCPDWPDFTFSNGAQVVGMTAYRNQNQYYVNDCGSCSGDLVNTVKNLDDLIAKSSATNNTSFTMLWTGSVPVVLSKLTDTTGKVSYRTWSYVNNNYSTEVGQGGYTITTVAGKRVLIIQVTSEQTPGSLVAPSDTSGNGYANTVDSRSIFVEMNGKVLSGNLYLKGQVPVTKTRPSLNRIAADDLLKAQRYLPTK